MEGRGAHLHAFTPLLVGAFVLNTGYGVSSGLRAEWAEGIREERDRGKTEREEASNVAPASRSGCLLGREDKGRGN